MTLPEASTHTRNALLVLAGWTIFGLFFAVQPYLNNLIAGRQKAYLQVVVPWLVCSYLWAVMTPIVIRLARQFPIEREHLITRISAHLLLGSMVAGVQLTSYVLIIRVVYAGEMAAVPIGQALQRTLIGEFHINLLIYAVLVGVNQSLDYYRRFREREGRARQLEVEAAQLEAQLTRAQLDALRMQLQPHFLFNTLNTISVLTEEDPKAANQMLLRLSDLLRVSLKNTEGDEVTLRRELAFLQSYLEIERTRFHDRLRVEIDAPPETLDARVPNLLLQPLVENAIQHAVAPRADETLVRVVAERRNGDLRLEVVDNGSGIEASNGGGNGIGLSNTRARLEKLYGIDHDFQVISSGDGVQVSITIPYRTEEEGAE